MRSLLLAAMAEGVSMIESPLFSPDTEAMIRVIKALGATVEHDSTSCTVLGMGGCIDRLKDVEIDIGNSGLALRFGTALFSLYREPIVITGDASIQNLRPIGALVSALQQLGGSFSWVKNKGFAPLRIQGPISSGRCTVDGTDSQPVSALLLSLPFVEGKSVIQVENMGERPWVEMTLSSLRSVGIHVESLDDDQFTLFGPQTALARCRTIPKDASAMAFPLVAALMTEAHIEIQEVPLDDVQRDIVILDYIKQMGGAIEYDTSCLKISGPQKLHGIDIDINEAVDALPCLAVLATKAKGRTRLFNGSICRCKESDRISVMAEALRLMGASITEYPDGLTIYESPLQGASLSCHADHRIAMALSVAGLSATGSTLIHGVECVSKSFPNFFPMLKQLGAKVEVCL
jgi:3-phosphoshikimate 1-carboxyvinyltransferase